MTFLGSRDPIVPDAITSLQRSCSHRWDWLEVVGGWGAAGTFSVKCRQCSLCMTFDIDDRFPPGHDKFFMQPEQLEHFNKKARTYYKRRRHLASMKAKAAS